MKPFEDVMDGDYVEVRPRWQPVGCRSVDVPYHVDRGFDRWVGSPSFRFWVVCVHDAEAYAADAELTDAERDRLFDPMYEDVRAERRDWWAARRQPSLFEGES